MIRSLFLIVFSFVSIASASSSQQQLAQTFNHLFKQIIVDVRVGSRSGHGDVAAAYLTIMDMMQNYQVKRESITVLVDTKSKQILDFLFQQNENFSSVLSLHTIDTLPAYQIFDLYLSLASPSGSLRYGEQIIERASDEFMTLQDESLTKINIKNTGVIIVQTVLGNTENPNSIHSNALVRSNSVDYEMSPAGIGPNEAGIYNDYVALSLRDQSLVEVRDFILNESVTVSDEFSRKVIQQILLNSSLQGARFSIVYGISSPTTKTQFMSYLKGLLNNEATDSFCLITPSQFDESDLSDLVLKSKIKILSDLQSLPKIAEKGKIYIIKTKTLPHKVFVGLMAYSMKKGFTPLGAGDGFMSAAINIGGPFVLTRVPWNTKNIENLKNHLILLAQKIYKNSRGDLSSLESDLNSLFGRTDLRKAQSLSSFYPLFAALSKVTPDLSERIINAAVMVATIPTKKNFTQLVDHSEGILDPTLRESVKSGGKLREKSLPQKVVQHYSYKDFLMDKKKSFPKTSRSMPSEKKCVFSLSDVEHKDKFKEQ